MLVRRILLTLALLGLGGLALWLYALHEPAPDARLACHYGAYRSDAGEALVVTPVSAPRSFRLVATSGETWRLDPAAGQQGAAPTKYELSRGWTGERTASASIEFAACDRGTMTIAGLAIGTTARRDTFDITETTFESHGLTLAGRLVMPRLEGRAPVAVLVHGSERDSARLFNRLQHMLPAHGVGVFVYDKRGTGASQGRYTQDFHVLADDAAAALTKARAMAGDLASEVGFEGGSQAGWIIPLAATKVKADFAVVGFGLTESPLAEDREEVFDDLRTAGYGEDAIAKAREITDATGRVMASKFKEGFDELNAVRAKYATEPWYGKIKGEFSGDFLAYPNWILAWIGPWFDVGTSWDYDPLPALRAYDGPHLWILAGRDSSAPSENTLRTLREIQAARPSLDIVMFPTADHGITEFEEKDGARIDTRFSEGYFQLLADWINFKDPKTRTAGPIVYDGTPPPTP